MPGIIKIKRVGKRQINFNGNCNCFRSGQKGLNKDFLVELRGYFNEHFRDM